MPLKLPAVKIDIYCDTCGHELQAFIEWNGNGEPDQGNSWLVSVCRCDACDHRKDIESYRKGWEDAKKYYPNLLKKGAKNE
jgi:predicted RNA polymerase sigma factor